MRDSCVCNALVQVRGIVAWTLGFDDYGVGGVGLQGGPVGCGCVLFRSGAV